MAVPDFVFTDHMVTVSNQLWMITGAVGACMCFVVLVLIGVVAIHPVSRTHLDRVSFRILSYALIANIVFGIANAIGGSFTGPTWTCGFTIWLLQLTLALSSFLIFCIALNLQLVVVHRINGQRMEKFYVVGSVFISLALTIPPYAAKQYGWDPLVQQCWYSNDNPKQRLAWQIGTQLFWTLLTVVGEVCTSITVIIYMIKHQSTIQVTTRSLTGTTPSPPGSVSGANRHVILANKYKNVLWRIGLYPFASCIINATSVMCVLHATVAVGVHDMNDYRILLLSDILYGGRAVVYALLTATDPAFLSAWRAFVSHERSSSSRFSTPNMGYPSRQHRTDTIQVKLTTTRRRDDDIELRKDPSSPKDISSQLGEHTLPPVQYIPFISHCEVVPPGLRDDAFVSRMRLKAEAENETCEKQQEEFTKQI